MTAPPQSVGRSANDYFWHCSLTGADELRSKGHAADARKVDGCFPDYRTGLCIQGHQFRVEPPDENHPRAVRYSPVGLTQGAGTERRDLRHVAWMVMPDLLTCCGGQRKYIVVAGSNIHHAVDHKRRHLP